MVQKEERVLGVLAVVRLEAWRDTFLLVLVRKAQWRVLQHLVGVQMARQVEHLGYSKGWSLASLEEPGQLLYCSQQTFWQRMVQAVHLPTGIQNRYVLSVLSRASPSKSQSKHGDNPIQTIHNPRGYKPQWHLQRLNYSS